MASQNGHDAVVELLLSRSDVSVNTQTEGGWTALILASQNGHDAVVRLLLSRSDVAVNTQAEGGWTALILGLPEWPRCSRQAAPLSL
jgi:ankyrin repeat protein